MLSLKELIKKKKRNSWSFFLYIGRVFNLQINQPTYPLFNSPPLSRTSYILNLLFDCRLTHPFSLRWVESKWDRFTRFATVIISKEERGW